MTNNNTRVELHLHTKLSDDISVIEPREALDYAIAHSHHAIAFTNLNNVQDFPTIADAYRRCECPTLKVIYGAEFRYMNEDGKAPYGVTILIKNQEGVKALYKIISSIHNDGVCNLADLAVLKKNRKNLLVGSCGNMGELYEAVANGKDPEKVAAFYDYFEIYPTDNEKERSVYKKICALGDELGVPVVATGNCHYVDKKDEICRRVIRTVDGHTEDNRKLYLHTTEEMLEEFSYLGADAAYNAVVTSPDQIAGQIEPVTPIREGVYPPIIENAYEQVHELAYVKAHELYGEELPVPIAERLQTELRYIQNGDFATHYLIAYRMVKYMKDQGQYVGARGSVGSLLVAFLLDITDTNPMPAHYVCPHCHFSDFGVAESDGFDLPDKSCPICGNALKADGHNLPCEFFMGYAGDKAPDIDLNFPASKRDEEIAFLQELFDADRLARAGTINTFSERFAESYITCYEAETADCFTEEQRKHICEKICGIKRGEGNHPGGILALPEGMEFEDFTPLRDNSTHSIIKKVSHFNFLNLHDTILKLDVLGHLVPDMLKMLEDFTGRSIQDVPWNDREIYALFARADTLGIPEFGTDFMKDMLPKTKPGCFADLVQISGLSHGANVWTDNGEVLLADGHALSELPALRDSVFLQLLSYGIERKSAFRITECTRKGRLRFENDTTAEFIRIMREANVPEWYIKSLQMIQYMFPKAHAVSYVMNAVRTAWFKLHYPTEFYAAYLSCFLQEPRDKEEASLFQDVVDECSAKGILLLEPDMEKSHPENYLPENGNIRMPYRK